MKPAPSSPLPGQLLIDIIQHVQQAAVQQAVQSAQQQFQQELGPAVQQSVNAAVTQALLPVTQLIQDGVARTFACQRNSLLCMGPDKGDVPLKWPELHGQPIPEQFDGQPRPATTNEVMKCNITIVDEMLRMYGQPHGPELDDDSVRRKSLLGYMGVYLL
eukprot:GHUV01045358.1.p1 GENE.GHUV01045358.1~~GHUV01045358.1.p1  ORF type:complete len:160 (+),score=52.15 GHUV01045358.1:205-684(+)